MSESGDDKGHHGQGNNRRRRILGGRGGRSRESGGSGRGGGNMNSDEKELASQLIQIQSKRFYIDVKENQRGRFIKLAEVGVGGRKSRIIMTMGAAAEFKTRLVELSELHSSLGPSHGTNAESSAPNNNANKRSTSGGGNGENDGLIKSETIVKDRKRYYLDLKENQRGRFLRVSMVVSRGPRAYLAIPAQGLIEFKDHLSDMLEKFGSVDGENEDRNDLGHEDEEDDNSSAGGGGGGNRRRRRPPPRSNQRDHSEGSTGGPQANKASTNDANLPESKSLRADNKTFYFDYGSNQRGVFVKISEVRQNRFRTSITIPEKYLKQFQEQVSQLSLNGGSGAGASVASVDTNEKLASTIGTNTVAATTTNTSGEKIANK